MQSIYSEGIVNLTKFLKQTDEKYGFWDIFSVPGCLDGQSRPAVRITIDQNSIIQLCLSLLNKPSLYIKPPCGRGGKHGFPH